MFGKAKLFWENLRGHEDDFGMEARIFHSLGILTMGILLTMAIINFIISLYNLTVLVGVALVLQFALYYISRFRGQLKLAIIIYAITGYLLLISNYFFNSGKAGPTAFGFFVTLLLLVTISQKRHHIWWLLIHIVVVFALLITEYMYPALVPFTYRSATDHFLDWSITFVVSLIFTFVVTSILRSYYVKEKLRAEERSRELLRQNEHLALLDSERSKLFSIISHDLRGPLANIQSLLVIQNSGKLTGEEKEYVRQELLKSTVNTREMLDNLLSWSKSQREDLTVQLTTFKFQELLDEILEVLYITAAHKNIFIEKQVEEGLRVFANQNYLQAILRNLVGNALKFTAVGGKVVVRAQKTAQEVSVSIEDSGTGISPEKQLLLFTPDVHSTAGTAKENGAGLGLLICKDLVEKQGGRIWFESAEGKGTTFFFTLPLPPAVKPEEYSHSKQSMDT